MFDVVTNAARNLELWLSRTFGRPYHALLGIGIVIEIVQHCRELPDKLDGAALLKTALAILLFVVLLVHQAGELSERAEQRRQHDE
ncbi:MAG TPA: hypothetical protein VK432_01330 [Stellaceae bacterium]|nr:hypothetical protein [Stellaceae bacterium]